MAQPARTSLSKCGICLRTSRTASASANHPSTARIARRWQSAEAQAATSAEASTSTSTRPSKSTASKARIVASMLLSRPPRRMSPLTSFEREFYKYSRKANRAMSGSFDPEWYFRKGSQGEQGYKELVDAAAKGKELQESEQPIDASAEADLHNSERMADRTLYLLVKKNRQEHAWQFVQGGVEKKESLVQAALRELKEEVGQELDVWQTGRIPAACHGYTPSNNKRTEVFFMPARVMRGAPAPNEAEGLVDFAWCTKEEVQERVEKAYYQAIEHTLCH